MRNRAALTWVSGVLAAMASLGAARLALEAPRPLEASGSVSRDFDQDGLADALERVLGTSPFLSDTDGDHYDDLEEFARGSDPTGSSSVPPDPAVQALDVHGSAYGASGKLHFVAAYFRTTGGNQDFRLRLGVQQGGVLRMLPMGFLAERTQVFTRPVEGGEVALIDIRLHPNVIRPNTSSSWVVAVNDARRPDSRAADSVQIHRLGTVHTLVLPLVQPDEGIATMDGGRSVYFPIPPNGEDDIPPDWTAGEICIRTASTVGVDGAVLTQEVTEAECQSNWDGYCGSECVSSIGETYTAVDPAILVGG